MKELRANSKKYTRKIQNSFLISNPQFGDFNLQ